MTNTITRRAVLAGSLAASAALAWPAAAGFNGPAPEAISERVEGLLKELSDLLSTHLEGRFRAIVEPSSQPSAQVFLQSMRFPLARAIEGEAAMTINGRTVIVNTHDVPERLSCSEEGAGPARYRETEVWMARPDALYGYINQAGNLTVGPLGSGYTFAYEKRRRVGFTPERKERCGSGHRIISEQVTVLGRVVAG